jgi:hypothetical protein
MLRLSISCPLLREKADADRLSVGRTVEGAAPTPPGSRLGRMEGIGHPPLGQGAGDNTLIIQRQSSRSAFTR